MVATAWSSSGADVSSCASASPPRPSSAGALRVLGATSGDIVRIYAMQIGVAALAGSLAGLAAGVLVTPLLAVAVLAQVQESAVVVVVRVELVVPQQLLLLVQVELVLLHLLLELQFSEVAAVAVLIMADLQLAVLVELVVVVMAVFLLLMGQQVME